MADNPETSGGPISPDQAFIPHGRPSTFHPSLTSTPAEFVPGHEWSFYGASTDTRVRRAEGEARGAEQQRRRKPRPTAPRWLRNILTLSALLIVGNLLIIGIGILILGLVAYFLVLDSTASALQVLEVTQTQLTIDQFFDFTGIVNQTTQFVASLILLNQLPLDSNPNLVSHIMVLIKENTGNLSEEIFAENLTVNPIYSGSSFSSLDLPNSLDISMGNESTADTIIYRFRNDACATTNTSCEISTSTIDFTIPFDPFTSSDFLIASETLQAGWTTLVSFASRSPQVTNFVPILVPENSTTVGFLAGFQLRLEGLGQAMNTDAFTIDPQGTPRIFIVIPQTSLLSPECPSVGLLLVSSNLSIPVSVELPDGVICLPVANNVNDPVTNMISNSVLGAFGSWSSIPPGSPFIRDNGFDITATVFMPFPGVPGTNMTQWVLVVGVPETVYLASFDTGYRIGIPIATATALLASLIMSILVTQRITHALDSIIKQMTLLTQLEFDKINLDPKKKRLQFKEIQRMNEATIVMAYGLLSFAKYVPRDVVQLLVRLKREAILGVDEVELTVS